MGIWEGRFPLHVPERHLLPMFRSWEPHAGIAQESVSAKAFVATSSCIDARLVTSTSGRRMATGPVSQARTNV